MEGGVPRSLADRGYLAGLVGVLTLQAGGVTYQIVTGQPVPGITVLATAFVIACMLRIHGLWGTMAFLALVLAIPFGSEFLGVLTGVPYGAYAYSDILGPRVLGLVPIFIFIAWVNIAYLAAATTTLGFGRSSLWLAPLDGVVAAAWDAMADPLAMRAGYWHWFASGGFYGVPLSNFLGWFLVVTLFSLAIRRVWSRDTRAPRQTSRVALAILPAMLLGSALSFAVLDVSGGFPLAPVVGISVLGAAAAGAWLHLSGVGRGQPAPSPWTPAPAPSGGTVTSGRPAGRS